MSANEGIVHHWVDLPDETFAEVIRYADHVRVVEELQQQLATAQAENTRLSELLWGARCVYCGDVIGKDRQNQDVADEVLKAHVQTCEKHPVFQLKAQLATAQAAVWEKVEKLVNHYVERDLRKRFMDDLRQAQQAREK